MSGYMAAVCKTAAYSSLRLAVLRNWLADPFDANEILPVAQRRSQ
jgi:hypothetical protein